MKYRIKDVINFVETSTCVTIVQAAKKLEISQPALSESIKRLEEDLGSILLYRSRTGIQLTPTGKVFLTKAKAAIQALNDLGIESQTENIFFGRTIVIGCHPTVAQYCLPNAIASLKKRAPDFKVELYHDLSRNVQIAIQKGQVDVGIVINATEVPDLIIRKLGSDTVGVWSAGSSDVLDTVICNANLFQTQSILKKWKDKPAKMISTDSLELICRLVEKKVGYGILPEKAVKLSGLRLKHHTALPTFKDEISLAYRPEFGKTAAEAMVVDAISLQMREL